MADTGGKNGMRETMRKKKLYLAAAPCQSDQQEAWFGTETEHQPRSDNSGIDVFH